MRYGDQGKDVLALQKKLSGLGYWLGEPDGSFGSLTQQAVFALQKAAGISRDGVVGPRTKKALEQGVRPRNQLSGSGVEIDIDRQLILVVRGGRPAMRDVILQAIGSHAFPSPPRNCPRQPLPKRGNSTLALASPLR